MERELVLSSFDVKSIPWNRPENFVTKFDNPLVLDKNKEYDAFIKEKTGGVKDSAGDMQYPIELTFSDTTFRVTLKLATSYQLDLTEGVNVAPRVPNLSQDTDILNIHCDLVDTSLVDGKESDIIYSFSTSVLKPSYSFEREPLRVTFNPINRNTISSGECMSLMEREDSLICMTLMWLIL